MYVYYTIRQTLNKFTRITILKSKYMRDLYSSNIITYFYGTKQNQVYWPRRLYLFVDGIYFVLKLKQSIFRWISILSSVIDSGGLCVCVCVCDPFACETNAESFFRFDDEIVKHFARTDDWHLNIRNENAGAGVQYERHLLFNVTAIVFSFLFCIFVSKHWLIYLFGIRCDAEERSRHFTFGF